MKSSLHKEVPVVVQIKIHRTSFTELETKHAAGIENCFEYYRKTKVAVSIHPQA